MATLITGAGLIGSHAARILLEREEATWLYDLKLEPATIASVVDPARVGLIQGDVEDLVRLEGVLREHKINRILHTAALLTAGIRQEPLRGIRTNILGTATVLEAARRAGARRVVLTSSSTVYYALFDQPAATPCPEDFAMRVVTQRPSSIYAATKLAGEHLGVLDADLYGVDVVVVRLAAVCGLWAGPSGGIAGRLMRTLLEPAIRGEPVVIDDPLLVWRGGDEFVDARDAAAGAVAALFAENPRSRVYSIGMGVLHGFEDFVRAAAEAVPGLRVEVRVEPSGGFAGYRHLRPQPSDIGAAKRELGWAPQYDLAAIMRECSAFLAGLRNEERR